MIKKIIKRHSLLLLVALFFSGIAFSCQDENSSLGDSLVESSFRNAFVDTCTVNIGTIITDSIKTLGDSITQIGHYNDPDFGEITSSYFAEYNYEKFTPEDGVAYVFDSITFNMGYSGQYSGDTLMPQKFYIYKIAHTINLNKSDALCNTSRIETESEQLFSFSFTPHPGRNIPVETRMPDSFGKQIFNDILADHDAFDKQDYFREYLHGLAVVPQSSGSCITGFAVNDSSMYMKIHYHVSSGSLESNTLKFSVNKDYAYTAVSHDRTSTNLQNIEKGTLNSMSSLYTGNKAYLQGLTGIYNSIEFPYLNQLEVTGDIVSIESATLYLYPAKGSYGKYSQLPQTLSLYIADGYDNIEDMVYDSSGYNAQDGSLVVDESYGNETYYSFDITSFMQENLGTWGDNRKKLFLCLENKEFACTFDQVVFANDPSVKSGQMRLDLRYKAYNRK